MLRKTIIFLLITILFSVIIYVLVSLETSFVTEKKLWNINDWPFYSKLELLILSPFSTVLFCLKIQKKL
jgi:hypothetical protein